MADVRTPAIRAALFYRDPDAGIAFLEAAFGFRRVHVIRTPDGQVAHAELRLGDSVLMLGGEWGERMKSPLSTGGLNTGVMHIHIAGAGDGSRSGDGDVDAHCARARAAGAVIDQEPEDQFFGDRTYRCRDAEGHMFVVAQTLRQVAPADWDREMGFSTEVYD